MPRKVPPLDLAIKTEDCGCKVMSTIDEELWIEFCALHKAAADLLAMCELTLEGLIAGMEDWMAVEIEGKLLPLIVKAKGEQGALDPTTGI